MRSDQFPKPFWRAARNNWFVQIDGKQVKLSPDKDEAFRLYHELMARKPEDRASPALQKNNAPLLAIQLVDDFLGWAKVNRAAGTYTIYKQYLTEFARSIPRGLEVADLKPYHVTRVMDGHADWGDNTKRNFATTVGRAFNWAEKQGYIDRTPLRHVEKPAYQPRETYVSPVDKETILAAVKLPAFRDLIELAWETGSRPNELRRIEAKHIQEGRIVFPPKEAKGKKYHRVIYLGTAKAAEIVARLAKVHSTGPILRNSEGAPWTKDAINCAFCRLKKKIGVKFHLGAYRKGFVTQGIKNGVDLATLAHLSGHRDATMISKVYSRVQADPVHMADSARRAVDGVTKKDA